MTDPDPKKQMAAALGRIPSGLFVVTVCQGDAETGMLASWVQQCSFDPPQISVAIKQGREVAAWLVKGAAFALNILDDSQTDVLIHFGKGFKLDEPAFDGLPMERSGNNVPILSEALAYLDCQVTARVSAGDHVLYIARVLGGRMLGEGHPMVHIRKSGMHY